MRVATAADTLEGYWMGTKGDSLVVGTNLGRRVVGLPGVERLWERTLSHAGPSLWFDAIGVLAGASTGFVITDGRASPEDSDYVRRMTLGGLAGGMFGYALGYSDTFARPVWRQPFP